jgi:hypothetical protein
MESMPTGVQASFDGATTSLHGTFQTSVSGDYAPRFMAPIAALSTGASASSGVAARPPGA